MLRVGVPVVISKQTGLPPLYGKKGKVKTCRYKDVTKNMDIIWQIELDKPLELNGVIIREVWLPDTALMEYIPTPNQKEVTWDEILA